MLTRSSLLVLSSLLAMSSAGAAPPRTLPARPTTPPPSLPFVFAARSTTLPGGLGLVEVSRPMLPLVHLTVVVQAGSELDPAEQPGLSALTARALDEGGAGARGPREVDQAVDDLGAELEVKYGRAGVTFEMAVESSRLGAALNLLGDIVSRPRFDETELLAVQSRQLDDRKHQLDDPHEQAEEAFAHALYGAHPYGHPIVGTLAAIAALRSRDLRAFWAAHYGPRTTTVLVVGDVGQSPISSLVSTAFGGWQSKATTPVIAPAITSAVTRLVLVDKPGAPQSEIRVGHSGEAWGTRDLAAASILEMVLGGSFTSRLVQNLRETRGYTYGITASWELERARGTFTVASALRTDATAPGIAEIIKELDAARAPIPVAELAKCRVMVESQFVKEWATAQGAIATLAHLVEYGQSVDILNQLVTAGAALTPATLSVAANTLIRPSQLLVVVVGDRKKIEASLRTLNIPIELQKAAEE